MRVLLLCALLLLSPVEAEAEGAAPPDESLDVLEALDDNFTHLKGGGGIAVTAPLSSLIGTLVYGFLSNDKRTVQQ